MYSLSGYGEMIADDVRTNAFVEAIRRTVTPGSVVLDIGTGTGFFALMACRSGARRVYAIEPSNVIDVARQMAAANGCAGSIEFIQALSTDISLPERVDVIVSDLRGVLPFFQNHIAAIADARQRFLAPGGVQIPRSDTLWLACVEAPDLHRSIASPWSDNKYGLDMRVARDLLANQWCRADVKPEQLMTLPGCCGSIDYSNIVNPGLHAKLRVDAKRAGTAHGICVWFDSILADGIHFSNSPENPKLIYGSAFFPWPEPVTLNAGETIAITLKGELIDGEYVWAWETVIQRQPTSGGDSIHFRQSEFFGQPMSLGQLRKLSASHVPVLNEGGKIDCLILKMMHEGTSLGDIASSLLSLHPLRFSRWQDALTRVAKLSATYSC